MQLTHNLPLLTLLVFGLVSTIGAFAGGLWAVVGISYALILFAAVWSTERKMPHPSPDLTAMALIALGVMALCNLVSSDPAISWFDWRRLCTIFLPLVLLSSPAVLRYAGYPKLFRWLPLLAALGAAALFAELINGGPLLHALKGPAASLQQYNRGLSYLVVLAFAVMAGQRTEDREQRTENLFRLLFSVLCLLLAASFTESRAAKLALVVGLAVTALAHIAPILTRRFLAILPVAFLGWPFAAQWFFIHHYAWLKHFPDSWRARMEIWDYMSYRIIERPWLGWGLGTSHTLDFRTPHGAQYVFTTVPASHPHDAVVQLWVEMGLPGLALGLAFAFLTLRKAGRLDAKLAPFALGAWAASLCLCMVAYSLWTDSLFAAFALTGVAFGFLERRVEIRG